MTTHQRNAIKISYSRTGILGSQYRYPRPHTYTGRAHTAMHSQQAEADGATPPAWKPCTGNQHSKNRPRFSALPSTDTRVQEAVHRYSGRASRWPSASRKPTPSRHLRPAMLPERPIIESKNSRSVIPTENPERYKNRRSAAIGN